MNNYDPSTGQVFREWTVSGRLNASASHDWSRRRPYPLFKTRGARGPRSLMDMAINVIADNIGDVSEELLGSMPTQLVWRIWRFLEARFVGSITIPHLEISGWDFGTSVKGVTDELVLEV